MTATDGDQLQDPVVLEALRRIASRDAAPALCPGCSRRHLPEGEDLCPPCKDERRRTSKADWWNRQGDYGGLLADGHRPAEAARRWLAHRLRRGEVPSSDVRADAAKAGIARPTLQRARASLERERRLAVRKEGRTTTWRLTSTNERTTRLN